MRGAALMGALAVALAPKLAEAQVIDGDNPVQIGLLTVGTVAGLTNAIAAVVYSAQNRAFDTPWVVSTFVSTAACGAFSVGLAIESGRTGDELLLAPAVLYLSLAAWPAAWAVRGALDEAPPGARLDEAHRRREERERLKDPFARSDRLPPLMAAVALPSIRF